MSRLPGTLSTTLPDMDDKHQRPALTSILDDKRPSLRLITRASDDSLESQPSSESFTTQVSPACDDFSSPATSINSPSSIDAVGHIRLHPLSPLPPCATPFQTSISDEKCKSPSVHSQPLSANLDIPIVAVDDAEWWWSHAFGNKLCDMLQGSQYSQPAMQRHVDLIRNIVCPALGPRPQLGVDGTLLPTSASYMCDDHCPVELGITWSKGKSLVRFSIDPFECAEVSVLNDGTLNTNASAALFLLDTLQNCGIGHFDNIKHMLRAAEGSCTRNELEREGKAQPNVNSQLFVGFDLGHDGTVMVKIYLVPFKQASYARKSNLTIAQDFFRTNELCCPAFDQIISYVRGHYSADGQLPLQPSQQPELVILATDGLKNICNARFKLYFRFPTTSFTDICRHLRLGGNLTTDWSLPLRQVWAALFGFDPVADDTSRSLPNNLDHLTGGVLIYYDLLPGDVEPTAKVYLPVRHWSANDAVVAQGIDFLLQQWGQASSSTPSYTATLEGCFPHLNLEATKSTHNYVCVALKRDGRFELGAYINPRVFS